jgi:hypothetical protein
MKASYRCAPSPQSLDGPPPPAVSAARRPPCTPAGLLWQSLLAVERLSLRLDTLAGFFVAAWEPRRHAAHSIQLEAWTGHRALRHRGRPAFEVLAPDGRAFARFAPQPSTCEASWASCLRTAGRLPARPALR